MGRTTWIRTGLCLLAALVLLCMGLALAEGGTDNPAVSLRINGEDSAVELLLREPAGVEISAPGATAVRVMLSEDYWAELTEWGEWEEWSQSSEEWNIRFDWDDWEGAVYAQACFDADPSAESAVWVRSNTVDVKVNVLGALEAHTIEHADRVQRGELLEVRVQDLDARADWTYASVFTDMTLFDQNHLGDVIYIPTAQLEPGVYNIGVGSCAVGYEDYWTEDAFTVTEPAEDIFIEPVYWNFTAMEVPTHEEVTFSACAMLPDVANTVVEVFNTEFGFCCSRWESGECNTNNCVVGRFNADRAGSYEFVCYLYHEGEEEPFEVGSFVLNVTADGTLDPVQLKLPSGIALNQPLNGTIVPVEGAQWYTLSFGIDRGDYWEWFENHDQEADNITIDYDGHWFDEVGLYCLSVGAHAHGKNSSYADAYLVVQPEEDERVTLSIGGETETLNCAANTQLPLVVTAPGGADVQYFDGNGWRGIDHLNNEIGYSGSESFAGGDYNVVARAWFDAIGDWRYSNIVRVHSETTKALGELELQLEATEVARGDDLKLSFDAAENATVYYLHLRNEDREFYAFSLTPGSYSLPTAMLEPGEYLMNVDYCGTGTDWGYAEQVITVTEGSQPQDIIVSLSANEVGCNERVILSVYAPGADMIRIFNDNNPDEDWFDERDGDTYVQDFNWDHPETLRFSAAACKDGTWSDRVEIGEVRVVESPQLDKPEIKLSSTLINVGEDVVFSFAKVENATQYWYELRDNDILNGNDQIMDGWCYEPASVTLPASLFRAGHTYRIEVHVGAPGYETNDVRYSLAVRPELVDGDITLSVNGETESVEGWVSDGIRVVASAPENATAIIVSDGMDWRWQSGNHFEDDFWYDFNGEVALIARYTVDKIDPEAEWWREVGWAGYSNPVTLTIRSNGSMPVMEADVPGSVARGEIMKIAITNADAFRSEGFDGLRLHAEAYSPDEDCGYGQYDWDGSDSITLPTADLPAGRSYELHLRADACGWISSNSVYPFRVTEPEGGILFDVDKTDVITNEDFLISVYAPGADQVKLFEGEWEIDCRDGDAYFQHHSHGEAAVLSFHAEAHMPDTGEWIKTETFAVNVTAPCGDIAESDLELSMPTRLNAGKALTISWLDFDLRNYDVDIVRIRDDVHVWHSWNDHGETEVTVPIVMPEGYDNMEQVLEPGTAVLEAGEFYRVNLDFQRAGFNNLHIEKQIVVVDDGMYAEGLTLIVGESSEEVSIPVCTDVPIRITAPQNATAILAWNGYGYEFFEGNEVRTVWSWGDANERMLYARFTTDEIVEGREWQQYAWSRVSNIVTVRPYISGTLSEVRATVPGSVTRGDFLEISVSNPTDFQDIAGLELTAEAYNPDEDLWYGRYDWDGEGAIRLPTVELEIGRSYELHLRARASGYPENESVYAFELTAPEGGAIRGGIDRTEVVTFEDFTITVYAPGADQVKIFEDDHEIDCRDGDFILSRHSRGETGEYRFHAEVHYPDERGWVACDEIVVNVTAPGGDIAAEEVNLQLQTRLTVGQELVIAWENAGTHHTDVELVRFSDDARVWHSWCDNGETEVTVPVMMPQEYEGMEAVLEPGTPILEAGEFYSLRVHFDRYGYNSLHIEKQIVVVDDGMYAEGLTLIVGESSEEARVPVCSDVPVRITAPQNATAILAWNGYDWEFFAGNEAVTVWSWSDASERMLYARYADDPYFEDKYWFDYNWSGLSNIVTVLPYVSGTLREVQATVPESVMRGQLLEISVDNPADFQGIAGLELTAEAYDPKEDLWFGRFEWNDEGTIRLPTVELEIGRSYELHLRARAPGYPENDSVYAFEVTEPDAQLLFDVSKREVETCEEFFISVYAPGADEVRIYSDNREIDRWDRVDWYAGKHWFSDAGDVAIHARIHYPDGRWEQTPDITVHVAATGAPLTADEVNFAVPSQLAQGNDLSVSWTDVGLYHYDLEVFRLSDGRRVWHNWNDHGETRVTVPAVMPEADHNVEQLLEPDETVLEAGEAYEVTLNAYRRGSNALYVGKQVLVTAEGMFDENISLQLSKVDVLVNEEVTVTVEAPENASAILAWGGYDWQWYDGNHAEFAWSWGDANERMLYAKYTTDPNANADSDWSSYEWSGLSNIVTVHVTKQGDVDAPVVTLSPTAPMRGDVLSFTVANADNGYSWSVYDPVDDWEWEWSDWHGNPTQEIDTYDLDGNRSYLLIVYKFGDVGYEGTTAEIPFTVTASGVAAAPQVEVATFVAQGDVLTIKIKNPEAGKLFRAWFRQEDRDMHFMSDWNGVDTIYLPTFNLTARLDTKLYILNEGLTGQERSCTVLPIKVDVPSGKLSLCMEKTDLVTQEGTYIVAYAAGAQSIRLYACHVDEPDNPFWNDTIEGEVWQDWRNFTGRSGKKIVTAVATYPDGSTKTKTMEVNVTAPYGDLPEPVIDAPDAVEPGAELSFSVTAKDAEWWFVELFDQSDEGRQLYHWDVDGYVDSRDFTVPADELVENHTYGINVYAARYAWNEVSAYREFTVATPDDPYAENVLRLPAALGEIEAEAFEGISARTVVIPDGTTSIGARAFADCANLKYVDLPDSVSSIAADAFAGSDVTFICNDGSTACAYAQEHGIPLR